jgi:PAS domain S-box-containing protein
VTDARRVERALLDERRRLASIIEGTGAGTWEWNVATGDVVLNPNWARIIGNRLDEFGRTTVQTWFDRVHPDDLPGLRAALQRHLSRQTDSFAFESRMRHRNGHWVWAHSRGRLLTRTADGLPEWMFGTQRDITVQVQQRQALELAHQRMALATESGGIGVWEYDPANGSLAWDNGMYRLYGLNPSDPDSGYERWARHLHPEDRAAAERSISDALAGQPALDTEFRIIRGDGQVRHLRATAKVLRDDRGQATRMIGVNWDVTPLRQMSAQLACQQGSALDDAGLAQAGSA